MHGYRFALERSTGYTFVICLKCERNAQAGVYLQHKPDCPEYSKRPQALKVGQTRHILVAYYPAIEKAWNDAAGI